MSNRQFNQKLINILENFLDTDLWLMTGDFYAVLDSFKDRSKGNVTWKFTGFF